MWGESLQPCLFTTRHHVSHSSLSAKVSARWSAHLARRPRKSTLSPANDNLTTPGQHLLLSGSGAKFCQPEFRFIAMVKDACGDFHHHSRRNTPQETQQLVPRKTEPKDEFNLLVNFKQGSKCKLGKRCIFQGVCGRSWDQPALSFLATLR